MPHDHDVEDSGERTPMLGRSSQSASSSQRDRGQSKALTVLQFFGGGIYAPDPSTYDPIKILLNEEDASKRDELTTAWKDNKLSELSFVGVVVCKEMPKFFRDCSI
jgi:hypothetical protein